jgi:hypothetical protein
MSDSKGQRYINTLFWYANATRAEILLDGGEHARKALGLPAWFGDHLDREFKQPDPNHISDPEGD